MNHPPFIFTTFGGSSPSEVVEEDANVQERNTETIVARDLLESGIEVKSAITPPGIESPAGRHTHPFDQLFYIVEGTMEVDVGGWHGTARKGDLVIFPAGVPHVNRNVEGVTSRHIVINLGVLS
jgi:mannose-6-phosphate isomerase-like protein (cupin superfamily)